MKRSLAVVSGVRGDSGREAVRAPGGRVGAVVPQRSGGERGKGGGSEPERSEGTTAARAEAGRFPGESEKTSIVGHGPADDRAVKGNTAQHFSAPDPEVSSNRARRRFTVAYKLEILRKADACTERGQLGVLLRREGLYASSVISWRRQREQGVLDALTPRKRGRKARPVDPLARKLAELERDNRRLQKRLEKAQLIIDFQKKVHELLGIPLNRPDDIEND